jgi:hypothetical protein
MSRASPRKTALVFFPEIPSPNYSGATQRCRTICRALTELGYDVVLASAEPASGADLSTRAEELRTLGIRAVEVPPPAGLPSRIYRRVRRQFGLPSAPVRTGLDLTTPTLRRWFRQLSATHRPELVLVNYSRWGALLAESSAPLKVIDSHDLWSLQQRLEAAAAQHVRIVHGRIESFAPAFIDAANSSGSTVAPSDEEFALFDQANLVLAISPAEAAILQQRCRHAQVALLPMMVPVGEAKSDYTGPALFASGPNIFNLQGYLLFGERILPTLRERTAGFRLWNTGRFYYHVAPPRYPEIELLGTVPDLNRYYRETRVALCPTFAGTGQQVKIVEAMARGVPVVAFRRRSEPDVLIDGRTGFAVDDAAQFADAAARLWNDPSAAAALGRNAQALIREKFSDTALREKLGALLDGATRQRESLPAN